MKVIIVGGVAGGATAAARIRRLDERASITIYERSGYISYANCGLPYYIGDEILDENELTLQTPLSFNKRYNIDVRVKHEVLDINPLEKRVLVKNLTTGEVVSYNADDEYHPASVIKLPIVMAVYKMASEGKVDLYEKLKVTYEQKKNNSKGPFRKQISNKKSHVWNVWYQ